MEGNFVSISLDLNECDICHHDDGEELVKCSLCEEPEEHPVHEGYSEILHTDMRAHRACFERDHEIHRMSTPRSLTPSALSALGAPTHLKRSVSLNASSSAMYEGLKDVISKMTQIRAWVGSTNKELNKEKEMNTLGVTSYQDGMYRCLSPNERRKKFAAAHFERTPRKSASHPDMADMNKNEDEGELVEDVFSDEDSIINNNQVNFSIYDTWSMDSHSGRSTPKIFSNRLEVPGMRHNSSSQDLTRLAKRKLLGSECSDLDNHDCPCDISSEGFQDENDIHHDGINTECLFGNHGDVENANAVLPSGGSGESEIVLERLDSSSTAANISSLESDSHPTTPVEKPPIPLVPKIILRGPSDSDMNKSIGDLLSDLRAELAMFSGDGSLPSSQQSSAASSPCPRRKNINHESTHPWEREQRDEGSEKHADNEKQCEERTIFQDFIVDSRSSPESMSIRNTRIGKSQSMDNVSCNSRNGNDKHVRSSTTEGTIPPGSPTRHKDCFPNCISRDRKTSWCSSDSRLDSHAGRGGNKTGSHGRVMGKEQPLLNTPLDCRLLARLGLSQRFLYEQMLRRQSEPIMAVAPVSPRLPTSARLSPEELSRKNNETKEKLKLHLRSEEELEILVTQLSHRIQDVSAALVNLLQERQCLQDQVEMRKVAIEQLVKFQTETQHHLPAGQQTSVEMSVIKQKLTRDREKRDNAENEKENLHSSNNKDYTSNNISVIRLTDEKMNEDSNSLETKNHGKMDTENPELTIISKQDVEKRCLAEKES